VIPRPPYELQLGEAVNLAMSGPRMLRLLRKAHPEFAMSIEWVRPVSIDLEPGRRCRIRYHLQCRRSQGGMRRLAAHLRLEPGGRAWADDLPAPDPGHLVDGSRNSPPTGCSQSEIDRQASEGCGLELTALESVLELLPLDRGLPGLGLALQPERIAECLNGSSVSPDRPPELRRWRIEQHRPGCSARLRYSLRVSAGAVYVYGELRSPEVARRLALLGRALEGAGIEAPRSLALLPDAGLLLQARLPGSTLSDLSAGFHPDILQMLTDLLRRLGRLGQPGVTRLVALDPDDMIRRATDQAMHLLPSLESRIAALAGRLMRDLAHASPVRATVHSDLRASGLRLGRTGLAFEDLDGLGFGPREWTPASLAADLGLRAMEGEAGAAGLRAAWLDHWRALGECSDASLAACESLTLLCRLAEPFARLDPDWPEGMVRRLELAEQCCARVAPGARPPRQASRVAGRGQGTGRVVPTEVSAVDGTRIGADPGLPQLAALRSPRIMTPRLRAALVEPGLEIRAIETMRHKPGRRCLLRYRVITAERDATWLVGKTFASSRGPRVYELHRRIYAGRAMGAEVHLPKALAYLPDLKLLLLSRLPGSPLAAQMLAGQSRPSEAMAVALARLHGSGLELEREHGLEHELALLDRRIIGLSRVNPKLGQATARARDELERRLAPWRAGWRRMPAHRDCYHEQFLFGPAGLSALDFDDAAMSDPTLDAGNSLAHLLLLSLQVPRSAGQMAQARSAFERGLRVSAVDYPAPLLALMECASLLRLVTIHHAGENGQRLARELLSAAQLSLTRVRSQTEPGSDLAPPGRSPLNTRIGKWEVS